MYKPIIFAIIFLATVSSCGILPETLQTKHSTDLEGRRIRRIAVLPPAVSAAAPAASVPFGAAPVARDFGEGSAGILGAFRLCCAGGVARLASGF